MNIRTCSKEIYLTEKGAQSSFVGGSSLTILPTVDLQLSLFWRRDLSVPPSSQQPSEGEKAEPTKIEPIPKTARSTRSTRSQASKVKAAKVVIKTTATNSVPTSRGKISQNPKKVSEGKNVEGGMKKDHSALWRDYLKLRDETSAMKDTLFALKATETRLITSNRKLTMAVSKLSAANIGGAKMSGRAKGSDVESIKQKYAPSSSSSSSSSSPPEVTESDLAVNVGPTKCYDPLKAGNSEEYKDPELEDVFEDFSQLLQIHRSLRNRISKAETKKLSEKPKEFSVASINDPAMVELFDTYSRLQREIDMARMTLDSLTNDYRPIELLEMDEVTKTLRWHLEMELQTHESLKCRLADARGKYISLQDKKTTQNLDYSLTLLRSLQYSDIYSQKY